MSESDPPRMLRAWPAFVALGVVVMLSLGMVGLDLVEDRAIASRTTELAGNALRSIQLVDDMRSQVHALAQPGDRTQRLVAARARLAYDAREYDPLATWPGEREEWTRLQQQLAPLLQPSSSTTPVDSTIEGTLDRLVDINQREALAMRDELAGVFRTGLLVDLAGVTAAIALALIVGGLLSRALRRQHVLLAAHLALLEDRRRELEAFAGRVAHDLRGALAPVRMAADIVAREVSPDLKPLVERIARGSVHMTAIIDDLLALSVSGHPGIGEADVAPVLRDVVDDLRPELEGADVALDLHDGRVRCSRSVLHQLVANLVVNAAKYRSPARRLAVAVGCTRADDTVEIDIEDNGIGMDAETAAHVFEPLFRGRMVRHLPGSGLGLAIVKRTVDALGGTCSVRSVPDRGTRISLRLPAA